MRKTRSDWVALHWAWYRDEVIEVIADAEPLVIALWPVLVAQAQEKSCKERNPLGVVSTTLKKLAASSRVPASKVEAILALLEEGEMLTISTGKLGTMQICLLNYAEWNRPRGSDSRRQQEARHKKRLQGKNAPLSQNVTARSQDVTALSQNVTTRHNTTQPNTSSSNDEPREPPKQVTSMNANERQQWRQRISDELSRFVDDTQLTYTVDRVEWKAKSQRYPADQWVWACRLTAEAIEKGTEISGDVMAYLARVVPGAGPPVGVKDGVVGSGRPEVVEKNRWLEAAAELERQYSGGGAA